MPKIHYVARHNGVIVNNRHSDRTYTHAIIGWKEGRGPAVMTWCGRLDLAQGELRKANRFGWTAVIVPAEIVEKPSNARTAKALNDSGVFAPFTVVGKD